MSTILEKEITTAMSSVDTARSEAFAERVLTALNEAGLLLMMSIGHRTGLFDAMGDLGRATSHQIAVAAGLNERYVREWLAALAVGRILEVDESGRFRLPPEHATLLRRDGEANLAVFAQYAFVLGGVEDDVVRCFHEGGGVPYERYTRFHEVMAEDSAQTGLTALHDRILPLVPDLPDRLARGIRVADLGCGRGRALLDLAERFPASTFVGYDLSADAVAFAAAQARAGAEHASGSRLPRGGGAPAGARFPERLLHRLPLEGPTVTTEERRGLWRIHRR
jgi:hypothetical protein